MITITDAKIMLSFKAAISRSKSTYVILHA